MFDVTIYTDGACKKNKKGAWAAILICQGQEKVLSGSSTSTTNNKMELQGPIEALNSLKISCNVTIYSDSEYVVKGATTWVHSWIKNGWKTKSGSPVKNQDEWKALVKAMSSHNVKFEWVKGHSNNEYNNRCDKIAVDLSNAV